VGFQHGYLLAPEIQDAFRAVRLELTHESKGWDFYREAAEKMLWPRIEREYREELQGMADGLRARGVKLDLWDIVAHNAWLELPYYVKWHDGRQKTPPAQTARVPERCSAFVATGSYTSDGRIVIGHNAWTSYMTGQRWNIIFDIVPASGHRILMDGMPGLIHSGDDFGMNAAGILITETTISGFHGFDPGGIAEFARARKAMQYSTSIDDFARIMQEGNNGGYANNWLVADRKNDEIASLELGLKNVTLERTRDGYYIGSNFPKNAKLAREETDFDLNNMGLSPNARRVAEQGGRRENGRPHVAGGGDGPCVRAGIPRRRAPEEISRVRLAEGRAARPAGAALDNVFHPVAGADRYTGTMRLRAAQNRLKVEHSIIDGVRELLEPLLAENPEIRSVIPGVIRPVRDARGKVKVRVTVPTQNGWKAIALSAGARQELFVSTALSQEELQRALERAGAQ
jgi:hypothetical protein